jgi:steroid delta-isomerase-like uncharacterized protein
MSVEQNRAVVMTMVEQAMLRGDIESALSAYAPDYVYHNPVMDEMPALPRGIDGMRLLMGGARAAFPDMVYTVEMVAAEEDRVAVLYSWTGTHTGEMAGLPATGRSVSATGAIFCRVQSGRIVEQWDIDDRLGVMQQLGFVPAGTASP